MFADAPVQHLEPHLRATTGTGRVIAVSPEQLGVTRDQLAFWVGRHVVDGNGHLLPGAVASLGNLARAWHERQPGTLTSITLTQTVTDLVHHEPDYTRTVATWRASGAS
jgi:hypothetical protein